MRFKLTLVLLLANLAVFFALWRLERPAPLILKPSGLIDFAPNHITIEDHIQNETRELELGADGHWQLLQPMQWVANDNAVWHLVTLLHKPDEQSFFSTEDMAKSKEPLSEYGLDKPRLEITIAGPGGRKVVLHVGIHTLAGNNLYVMNPADQLVRVWTDDFLQSVETPVKELRDNQIFTIPFFEVRGLSIWSPNLVRFTTQDSYQWLLDTPLQRPADSKQVIKVVQQLHNLTVVDFLAPAEANLARQGLASPSLSVELKGENGSQKLLLGTVVPNSPVPEFYAKREDSEAIFTVRAGEPFDTLRLAQEKLREHEFFAFDPEKVSTITVRAFDAELRMLKSESGETPWKVQMPDAASGTPTKLAADPEVVRTLLDGLRNLTAKTFVSDAPHDLEVYGLDKPTWNVTLQMDKTTLAVSIGHSKTSPYLYYAKTDNSDSVYEIEGDIIGELSIEQLHYRYRIFETLPPTAQISSLKLTRLKDDLSDDGAPVFSYTAETGKSLDGQFKAQQTAQNQNLYALCNWLRSAAVDSYFKASFSEQTPFSLPMNSSSGPRQISWRYRLDAGIQTPAAGQAPTQNQILTFYFTEKYGGLQAGGAHTPSEAVFQLPISVVSIIAALTSETSLPPSATQALNDMKQPIDPRGTTTTPASTATAPAPGNQSAPAPANGATTTAPAQSTTSSPAL